MDLAAAVRDGISFFTHKATEGTRTRHVHYGEAMRRARAAGMPVYGAYVVPRTPGSGGHGSIAQQVDYYLAYLDAQTPWWHRTPEFFHQVDSEHWGYDNVSPVLGAQACDLIRRKTGQWVIHYAPRWGYGDTIPGSDPLWASSYGKNPAVHYRQAYPGDGASGWAPYSGRTPTFLQYGSRLTIGSQPICDANAFRGTLADLRALITGNTGTTTGEDEMKAVLVRAKGDGRVYLSNGVTRWWVPTEAVLADIQGGVNTLLGHLVTPTVQVVDDIDAFGVEVPAGLATRLDGMTSGGAPNQDQVNVAVAEAMKDPEVAAALGAGFLAALRAS